MAQQKTVDEPKKEQPKATEQKVSSEPASTVKKEPETKSITKKIEAQDLNLIANQATLKIIRIFLLIILRGSFELQIDA